MICVANCKCFSIFSLFINILVSYFCLSIFPSLKVLILFILSFFLFLSLSLSQFKLSLIELHHILLLLDCKPQPFTWLIVYVCVRAVLANLFSIKPTLRKVPRFGVKIERMLLNARKEVGFTVNLKAVKKDQFKSEDTRQENQQTPEWSWKKQQQEQSS